jgi:hypothetical protein
VQTRGGAHARQWLLGLETLSDLSENGHVLVGPLDTRLAGSRQPEVLHVMIHEIDIPFVDDIQRL